MNLKICNKWQKDWQTEEIGNQCLITLRKTMHWKQNWENKEIKTQASENTVLSRNDWTDLNEHLLSCNWIKCNYSCPCASTTDAQAHTPTYFHELKNSIGVQKAGWHTWVTTPLEWVKSLSEILQVNIFFTYLQLMFIENSKRWNFTNIYPF